MGDIGHLNGGKENAYNFSMDLSKRADLYDNTCASWEKNHLPGEKLHAHKKTVLSQGRLFNETEYL